MAGTLRHQDAATRQNQSLILISVWQHLALAGIGKQLVPFFHGMDHGIAAHTISAAFQYHVVRVERFMVSVIAHIPRRFLHLQFIRSHLVPGIRWSVTLPLQILGMP